MTQKQVMTEKETMQEYVVLVNVEGKEVGTSDKLRAHQDGVLHRAFSVFLVNSKGKMLLQQRTWSKYHSAGLWSNTCCSHPRPEESLAEAVQRRLREEMGIACATHEVFQFTYQTDLENGLSEHEYDHVFLGMYEGSPLPNEQEVADWKWMEFSRLQEDLKQHPQNYTYWFRLCLDRVLTHVPQMSP